MAKNKEVKRYLENMEDELNSSALYSALAGCEKSPQKAAVYKKLAVTEQKHAAVWQEKIIAAGEIVPRFSPSWRTRVLGWLAEKFGVAAVLPTLASLEQANSLDYANQADASALVASERSHALLLKQMSQEAQGKGMEGGALAKLEGLHKTAGGNALRAAVLGASDGLLSNFNLVMGVAGAQMSSHSILLTGFAGLLAGAISMALGEWISVQSSRELYEKQIQTEKEEILTSPDEELEELVLIYQARGLDEATARSLAAQLMSNPETALDTLARDELGIDPEELGGSAWEAALTSFFLFAAGAVIPIVPYLFLSGTAAILVSALFGAVGLFGIGAAITLFTGRSVLISGLRQVLFGLTAAAAVYSVGWLIGVTVAG
ncbi:Hypothetical protein LUCI_3615 [Lucifera butyrica]|uniref:Rubrerythrin family protein n=1 Tax=Lucifera butyrica TaxID=1351585 RepID=A0A498RE39_9FIRM|nr:VIT1/CCC1 transporter family protein [Lucifera butyrica]VBB08343.1 Hypothetical protein LUCI_3615 [Lucifera butyrica]